ncbi:MAG: DUF3179 domain-containing protein [Proteobacteria bacterium]|nr:DUF3179 domain-containing protein [Pseudomonadota bacterium]
MTTKSKLIVLTASIALIAAACSSASGSDEPASTDATSPATAPQETPTSTTAFVNNGELPEGTSALDNRYDDAFPEPLIDPADVLSGGPPPDGIPPIDNPEFISVADADDWLNDVEPVLVVDVEGDVRVYPIQIMMWHEIVNDTVGGRPLAVTYCPLCNSAISFERVVRGVETTFGTSGSLYNANLVMYDRATESLWNQLDGRAVIGVLTGDVLEQYPSSTMSWSTVKESRPDALVLDKDRTGASRRYGTNPYTGLDDPNGQPFLFNGEVDVRAKAMQRIVAIENENAAAAWTIDFLSGDADAVATQAEFDGEPLAILWQAGEASALDTSEITAGRDVGTVGVFSAIVDDQELTFSVEGDTFVDDQTSSEWNILGEAVSGSLEGSRLEPVTFVRTFWFSWAAFRPDTDLVES